VEWLHCPPTRPYELVRCSLIPGPGHPLKPTAAIARCNLQAPQVTSHLTGAFCNALHGGPQALSTGSFPGRGSTGSVCANPVPPQSRGQLLTFSAIFPPSGLGAFYKSRGSSSFLAFSLASYHTIQIQSTQKSTSTQLQDDFIIIQPVAILSAIVAITTQRPNTTTSPLPHTTLLHHGAYASPLKIIFHLLSQQVQSQP
jgi:hypothetical protein